MNRIELLKIREIAIEKKDRIIEKIIEAYKDIEGCDYFMHIDVVINKNGDIYNSKPLLQGQHLEEELMNEVKLIASCVAWEIDREYTFDFSTYFDKIKNKNELIKEFKNSNINPNLFAFFIEKFHPETIEEMQNEFKKDLFNDFFTNNALEYFKSFIKNIE